MQLNDLSIWTEKGETLSAKNASKEYGLTHGEIIEAINKSKLQFKLNYAHGNPYYKLVRNEVEAVVIEKFGKNYLKQKKLKTELERVNKEIRKNHRSIKMLEKQKTELEIKLNEISYDK